MEESLLKAMRSLETGVCHIYHKKFDDWSDAQLLEYIKDATDDRLYAIAQLIRNGIDLVLIYDNTKIDMFFLEKFKNIVEFEREVKAHPMDVETQAHGIQRQVHRPVVGHLAAGRIPAARKERPLPRLQDDRHLCQRIQLLCALFLLDLRGRERVGCER